MKFRHIATVITATLLLAAGCGHKGPRVIECSPEILADLGDVREADGPVSFRLVVTNRTADTLFPLRTATGCSCLSAEAQKTPVAPGAKMSIEASYNPAGENGPAMEEVQVLYATGADPTRPAGYISLLVKARVEPIPTPLEQDYPYDFGQGLHLSHETLVFGVETDRQQRIALRAASTLKKKAAVTFEMPEDLRGSVEFRNLTLEAGGRDTLSVGLRLGGVFFEKGMDSLAVYPCVNGKRCDKPLVIRYLYKD